MPAITDWYTLQVRVSVKSTTPKTNSATCSAMTKIRTNRLRSGRLNLYRSAKKEKLYQRPYCLDIPPYAANSWQRFQDLWEKVQDWPRSRAKAFLEALTDDREAEMKRACNAANIELPAPNALSEFWDPLEMLDFHVQFNQPTARSANA